MPLDIGIMMFINILHALLFFSNFVSALTKEQTFDLDWQTVNTGVPFDSILIDDKLIILTSLDILAISNSTNGDILYRYQSEMPFDITSQLIQYQDSKIITYFNYQNDTLGSRLIFWSVDSTYGLIEKEISFEARIVNLFPFEDSVYVIDLLGSLFQISPKDEFNVVQLLSTEIQTAYATSVTDKRSKHITFFLEDSNGKVSYFSLDGDNQPSILKEFLGCKVSSIRFDTDKDTNIICDNKIIYRLDENDTSKIKSGLNMATAELSVDNLINTPIFKFDVINDYVLIFSDNKVSVFNKSFIEFEPLVTLPLPHEFNECQSYSFFVSDLGNVIELILITTEQEIKYYKNSRLQWSKDQSLAYIIDAVVIDTKVNTSLTLEDLLLEENSNFLSAYFHRLYRNYNSLFGRGDKKVNFNKQFGLLKKLVVLTKNGKIGVFDTYANEDKSIPQLLDIFQSNKELKKLYSVNEEVYTVDDSLNVYKVDLEQRVVSNADSNFVDSNFNFFINADNQKDIIKTENKEFYSISLSENNHKLLKGFHILNGVQQDTWSILCNENEEIIKVARRSYSNDKVANNGIVLPDKSVLYKYLIPNLLIAAVYSSQTSVIRFELLNMVTGQIYQSFSRNSMYPESLEIIYEENFIILTLSEEFETESTITVIDLFESLTPDIKQTSKCELYSVFTEPTIFPEYTMQSFVVPGTTFESAASINTKYNIARKFIMAKTQMGFIAAFPKFVLDSRRTTEVTKENQGMTFKYDPVVGVNEKAILTHQRNLVKTGNKEYRHLFSVSTELESASILISIDGDIFVSIFQPSSSFDKLTSEFNKTILSMTIIVLILGIFIVKPKVAANKLKTMFSL